jgi:hypothetical protein
VRGAIVFSTLLAFLDRNSGGGERGGERSAVVGPLGGGDLDSELFLELQVAREQDDDGGRAQTWDVDEMLAGVEEPVDRWRHAAGGEAERDRLAWGVCGQDDRRELRVGSGGEVVALGREPLEPSDHDLGDEILDGAEAPAPEPGERGEEVTRRGDRLEAGEDGWQESRKRGVIAGGVGRDRGAIPGGVVDRDEEGVEACAERARLAEQAAGGGGVERALAVQPPG